MEHTTITIGRQFGSRGRQIAKELAKRLGFSYYDKELLLKASKESGLSAAFLETMDERQASPFFYSLLNVCKLLKIPFLKTNINSNLFYKGFLYF